MIPSRRELYRSHNGDSWFLARDPSDGHVFILHEPNLPSGGHRSQIEIGDFLRAGGNSAEHQALLRLIGTLVEPALQSPDMLSAAATGDGPRSPGSTAAAKAMAEAGLDKALAKSRAPEPVKQSRKKQLTKMPKELRGKDNSGG